MDPDVKAAIEQWNALPDYPVLAPQGVDPGAIAQARIFCAALAEALSNRRPAAQFSRWLDQGSWSKLASWAKANSGQPTRIVSVKLSQSGPGQVFVYTRYACTKQTLAVSIVLVSGQTKWTCQSLDILWPGAKLTTPPSTEEQPS